MNDVNFGIVRSIGWDEDDEGNPVFRAIVDFPNGAPDLPMKAVFGCLPVDIVLRQKDTPEAHPSAGEALSPHNQWVR